VPVEIEVHTVPQFKAPIYIALELEGLELYDIFIVFQAKYSVWEQYIYSKLGHLWQISFFYSSLYIIVCVEILDWIIKNDTLHKIYFLVKIYNFCPILTKLGQTHYLISDYFHQVSWE
jgi:hypothetical protein